MSRDGNKIIVRARYNHVNKYIFLDVLCVDNCLDQGLYDRHNCIFYTSNFDCTNLQILVKKVFHITANKIKVQLFDNIGANIPKEHFADIVSQYQSSASFFVDVNVIESDMDASIVTVKVCFIDAFSVLHRNKMTFLF